MCTFVCILRSRLLTANRSYRGEYWAASWNAIHAEKVNSPTVLRFRNKKPSDSQDLWPVTFNVQFFPLEPSPHFTRIATASPDFSPESRFALSARCFDNNKEMDAPVFHFFFFSTPLSTRATSVGFDFTERFFDHPEAIFDSSKIRGLLGILSYEIFRNLFGVLSTRCWN